MNVLEPRELRARCTENSTYFVLGEEVRKELLAFINHLQSEQQPRDFNKYDKDALFKMQNWIKEGNDFNDKQWAKFAKMLMKFDIPHKLTEIAEAFEWVVGDDLTRDEMRQVMEDRRRAERLRKFTK